MYAPLPELREEPALHGPRGVVARPARPWPTVADPVVLIAGLLLVVMGFWVTRGGTRVTPDSIQYLSTAQRIAAGDGVVSAVTPLDDPRLTVPFAAWPPLYPWLLGEATRLGVVSPVAAARWVNLVAAFAGVLGVAAFAGFLSGRNAARAAALGWGGLFTASLLVSFVWSEALFIAFAVWGAVALARGIVRERGFPWELAVGGALLGLAGLTRYIGFAWIAAGVFGTVALTLADGPRRWIRNALLVALPAAAPGLFWLLRNRRLTGHLFGDERPPGAGSLSDGLVDAAAATARDFLHPLAPLGGPVAAAALACVALAALVGMVALIRNARAVRTPELDRRSGAFLLTVIFLGAHGLAVLLSTAQVKLDPVSTRYLAPAYPLAIALAMTVAAALLFSDRRRERRVGRRVAGATMLVLLLAPHVTAAVTMGRRADREERTLTAPYWTSRLATPESGRSEGAMARIRELAAPGTPVLTNAWEAVMIATGLPVKPLPEPGEQRVMERLTAFPGALIAVNGAVRPYRLGDADIRRLIVNGGPFEPVGVSPPWTFYRIRRNAESR